MNTMLDKLATLWPEIIMLLGACACLAVGLARQVEVRRLSSFITAVTLVLAGALNLVMGDGSGELGQIAMPGYVKLAVCGVGLLLLLLIEGVPDQLTFSRDDETGAAPFDPANVMRGEFFAFFLLSLTGVMLTAGATDLVWLLLALELTSLPTYVMVATSRDRAEAQEAAVKYFFLGAMAAALFLYGFTFIYGATGFTNFSDIRTAVATQGTSPMLLLGLTLSLIGLGFKIAAAPMHFYVADVYQGATTAVTAMLAFVPKVAGFVAIILVLSLCTRGDAGEFDPQILPLPLPLSWVVWFMAAFTMTLGNVLGLLQSNVKRVLAYSSIAHSGYMLVPLTAGTVVLEGTTLGNTVAAVLFYLVVYGLATIGAFAVIGCLERDGDEAQTYEDLGGLAKRKPLLAAVMLMSVLSLIGLPTTAGFLGKIYLFGSAISFSEHNPQLLWLVIIAVINSAISAVYYLRIASACFFDPMVPGVTVRPLVSRQLGGAIAAILAIVLGFVGGYLVEAARDAGGPPTVKATLITPPAPAIDEPLTRAGT
jgi:NADH-quinone oxidoreductase subunit N